MSFVIGWMLFKICGYGFGCEVLQVCSLDCKCKVPGDVCERCYVEETWCRPLSAAGIYPGATSVMIMVNDLADERIARCLLMIPLCCTRGDCAEQARAVAQIMILRKPRSSSSRKPSDAGRDFS